MAWGTSLWRRMKVFMVAFTVFFDYRSVRKRVNGSTDEKWDAVWERAHRKNSARILAAIKELEGLWIKFGQYLSSRADVLPDAYIKSFRELQDSLAPRPISEVRETIARELGSLPEDLFLEFDEVPLATASIAQVHRARMKDGSRVVVKIQHQGIKECLLQDLENARKVVEWVAWAEPEYDFGPMINEWCREVPKELNFIIEAENTRQVSHNLKSWKNDMGIVEPVDVLIPEVVQSTEKVLILTYMEGVRLTDRTALEEMNVDKQGLVETITRAYAHQIYIDGFFNADPHPGNFLVSIHPPHRPILLDFGLTKAITPTLKKALAKMLLAAAEVDYAALLSAFSEMGLKLKLDIPEEAMQITSFFFRNSQPAKESVEELKFRVKESDERMKVIQSKMDKAQRNPVSAFPSDAVFFTRVLSLLRGISSLLDTKVAYMNIMRPYAEATLGSKSEELSVYNSILHSQVEQNVRDLLHKMFKDDRILGIQVCAYKDGKVIIDTAAGVRAKYDPRPVQPDTLFPVFSVTKGVAAGLIHWLADHGKLSLGGRVSEFWPEFSSNNKETCTVAHVLNHTAGLHNLFLDLVSEDPRLLCNWDEMLKSSAAASPTCPPGQEQKYHSLSFGWLCGGIAEKVSGCSFQDLLEEAFVRPLGVSGEFYIGIPPGTEDRLASLTLDTVAFDHLVSRIPAAAVENRLESNAQTRIPESVSSMVQTGALLKSVAQLPGIFNLLFIRRAVIPAANGHFSARALARYYAMLANGGRVPIITSSTKPSLGSHPQVPSTDEPPARKQETGRKGCCITRRSPSEDGSSFHPVAAAATAEGPDGEPAAIFTKRDEMYDAFLGTGKYKDLVVESEEFGLGFRKLPRAGSRVTPFGHSGIGGSVAYCDPDHDFAIAITVNKMSLGGVAADIVKLVCSEIGVPCPSRFLEFGSRDMVIN